MIQLNRVLYMGRYGKLSTMCKEVTTGDRIRQGIIQKQGKELLEGQNVVER
jgi:hypothetical protein